LLLLLFFIPGSLPPQRPTSTEPCANLAADLAAVYCNEVKASADVIERYFPYAFFIPGPKHGSHNVSQDMMKSMPAFGAWCKQLKALELILGFVDGPTTTPSACCLAHMCLCVCVCTFKIIIEETGRNAKTGPCAQKVRTLVWALAGRLRASDLVRAGRAVRASTCLNGSAATPRATSMSTRARSLRTPRLMRVSGRTRRVRRFLYYCASPIIFLEAPEH
jgi:hypothetical protein